MINLSINFSPKALANLEAKVAQIKTKQLEIMQNLASEMEKELKEKLSSPVDVSAGNVLRSLPGEPPRKESGQLRQSIEAALTAQTSQSGSQATIKAGCLNTTLPYAFFLEYGTQSIMPRPFLLPTLAKYSEQIAKEFKEAL
ncbi:MAG: hypothetical protein LBM71_05655 [Elusimicrobiota bacterium]|jgi:HK97 gp10 family phage protein|nr:hypothetical protein [Elusimicrobiota bacterium]